MLCAFCFRCCMSRTVSRNSIYLCMHTHTHTHTHTYYYDLGEIRYKRPAHNSVEDLLLRENSLRDCHTFLMAVNEVTFESKERLGKVCKLVQYKIFCLVVHSSWHITSTCYRALSGKSFMKKLTSQTGFYPFYKLLTRFVFHKLYLSFNFFVKWNSLL